MSDIQKIEGRIDQGVTRSLAISNEGASVPKFETMAQVLEFAKVMAVSGIAIRPHLRGQPGACAAIVMQAMRWEFDPFMVGNKSFEVNGQMGYESQLINAVINVRAPITGRLKTRFIGEGPARKCIAYATMIGDDAPTEVESPKISDIKPQNSPLWKTDPDQQLAYYTKRAWARRECPEVLLGVYDREELEPAAPMRDVTPAAEIVEPLPRSSKLDAFESRIDQAHNKPVKPLQGEVMPRASHAETPPTKTNEYSRHTLLDAAGEDAGNYLAPRAAANLCGWVRVAPPAEVIAIYEHNAGTIAEIEAQGIDVQELHDAYAAAQAALAAAEPPHDPETGEIDQGRPEERQERAEAAFWAGESLRITPPLDAKGKPDYEAWDAAMRQAGGDAQTAEEFARLDNDNAVHWSVWKLRQASKAASLRAYFSARAQELMA